MNGDKRKFARLPTMDPEVVRQARQEMDSIRREPWFREDGWSVSRHNFREDTLPPKHIPKRVTIVDLSGRLIEQLPGIALTSEEKLAVARAAAECGIEQIHGSLHVSKPEGAAHVRAIVDAGLPLKVVSLCITDNDLHAAAKAGTHIAEIMSHAVAGINATYTGARVPSQDELLAQAVNRVKIGKSLGMQVRADVNIVAYVDLDYLRKWASAVAEAGADYINLCDGTGGLAPRGAALLVKTAKEGAPKVPVGVHLHNDFGLSLSNALASLEAGAEVFESSIHQIGEQAGQLCTAQFAMTMHVMYQVQTGIKFENLYNLSKVVQDVSRIPIPGFSPIVGEYSFDAALEGAQKRQVLVDPNDHIPIVPAFVGGRRSVNLSRYTGPFSLVYKADEVGIEIPEDAIPAILEELDGWFVVSKRRIENHELARILRKHGGRHKTEAVPEPAGARG